MKLTELIGILERELPTGAAIAGDRTGLQLQSGRTDVSSILVAYELTPAVVREAVSLGADCIIAFHPLIFTPLTAITELDRVGSIVTELIKNSIALIVVHTIFDCHPQGTSYKLAQALGFKPRGPIFPDAERPGYGMGVIANCPSALQGKALAALLAEKLGSPVKYAEGRDYPIKTVAIIGGSGGSFLAEIENMGFDAFITADISYHTFHRVSGRTWLFDPGHYETESLVASALADLLFNILPGENLLTINTSSISTNPVRYAIG
ncbi:MAG: Nif3-like dinuclear metal center hexameric protein [Chloroflexota bacterium]